MVYVVALKVTWLVLNMLLLSVELSVADHLSLAACTFLSVFVLCPEFSFLDFGAVELALDLCLLREVAGAGASR